MKNYKPKNVVIEEIIRETSIPRAPNIVTSIIDEILSYKRTNVDSPSHKIVL